MDPGPRTREQLRRLDSVWEQGQHVAITGPTGSGKSELARPIIQLRLNHGGHAIVMVGKLRPDDTILNSYKDFTRWTRWKKKPPSYEKKILLWPETSKLPMRAALAHQKQIFQEALDELSMVGLYTFVVDEGLYTSHPQFLNMSQDLAILHQMGRSSRLTMITLAQRPAHLPLVVYSSASHAFIGRAREAADMKRMAELGGKEGSRELGARISNQDLHEFTWVPIHESWPAETVNLAK